MVPPPATTSTFAPVAREPLIGIVQPAGFRVVRGFRLADLALEIEERFVDKPRLPIVIGERSIGQQAPHDAAPLDQVLEQSLEMLARSLERSEVRQEQRVRI